METVSRVLVPTSVFVVWLTPSVNTTARGEVCLLPFTASAHSGNFMFPAQPERSLEEHLIRCLVETAAASHPSNLELKVKLDYLGRLLSGCAYNVRKNVLSSGLTEISLSLYGGEEPHPVIPGYLHPGNSASVPWLLQPPWLLFNRAAISTRETNITCCPGHCRFPHCTKYCFDAMIEFMDRLSSPYTFLSVDQLADAFMYDAAKEGRPFNVHVDGPRMMARLMLTRVMGPLDDYTHPITYFASFCGCPGTGQQQEPCPLADRGTWDEKASWSIEYAPVQTQNGGPKD